MQNFNKIAILGGTSGFGKWLAGFLGREFIKNISKNPEKLIKNNLNNLEINITGTNLNKGENAILDLKKELVSEIKLENFSILEEEYIEPKDENMENSIYSFSEKENFKISFYNKSENSKNYFIKINFTEDNIKAIKNSEIIVYSLPISILEKVVKNTSEYITNDKIVLDVTSVKILPSNLFKKYLDKETLVIPTHPMFGPYYRNISGQVVVLTPENRFKENEIFLKFRNWLEEIGAEVIVTEPEEHDKLMSIVQGLNHFTMFTFARTLYKLNIDINKSLEFVSPIYKLMLSSVTRYAGQDPSLYANIHLNNDIIPEVHKAFIESATDLSELTINKDFNGFVDYVKSMQDYFKDDSKRGQKYTDKITYFISQECKKLHAKIGEEISVKNIYSGKILSGVLEGLKVEELIIDGVNYDLNEYILI